MNLRGRIRDSSQSIYFLGQNPITLTGAVITTNTALTTIAFWFYEIFLPGPPHPTSASWSFSPFPPFSYWAYC